jgi:CRISPR-associated exonuclease Cas4
MSRDALGLAIGTIAAGCLVSAIVLLVLWRRSRGKLTDAYIVVASDTGVAPSRSLYEPMMGLRGRPDYLLEPTHGGRRVLIPLEVKPTRRATRLYDGDEEQLAAYLLALRAEEPERAAGYGYVRYGDAVGAGRTFRVELTPALTERVRRRVTAIRAQRRETTVHRSHVQPGRCRACPVRDACDERLA